MIEADKEFKLSVLDAMLIVSLIEMFADNGREYHRIKRKLENQLGR